MSALLGNLVDIIGGGTPSKSNPGYWGGDIPWASVKDFKTTRLEVTADYITELGVSKSATNVIPAGNIIIPTRMALGKVALNIVDMAINQDLKALIAKDETVIFKPYLLRFLESKAKYLEEQGKGATVKGITLDVLRHLEVPLPHIDEQKRIAAILDEADEVRRKRQKAINLADDFLRAVFLKMFGDPISNPKSYPVGSIRDLLEEAKYGTSAKASETEGEYPVLRMGNITYQGRWNLDDLKYVDLSEKEQPKYLAHKGDLVFNRTNSRELVGKTAVYSFDYPMALAGYLIRARVNEKGNPYYISAYLNSKHGKRTLMNMCKSIVGMANINAQEMQDIKILIPPIEEQVKYQEIELTILNRLGQMNSSSDQIDELFKSLSQKAFSGQL
ncbi:MULTISPECIES: restriction endonuclease subunit S [unclassified Endozoicomonas]|uniref:restriction endonuclease subunit S n=1 Tax=unclassified Endozoicomonas TaxID=2644528 RepID=UPI003BB6E5A5